MMRSSLRFLGAVLLRMGILSIGAALIGTVLMVFLILKPSSKLSQMADQLMGEWILRISGGIEAYQPDKFIFDYTLGEDVPRLYYLEIPRLDLIAPVVAVSQRQVELGGIRVTQLYVPNAFAVGWSEASAPIGARGNTVLVGHNNIYGEVFKNLWDLEVGDEIIVRGASGERVYHVSQTSIFEENGQSLDIRLANAWWVDPVPYEQLTLITCWPDFTNTHRVVIVALPA
jgi:LPXTG-site transpeptidase (sortase) family protein